MAPSKGTKRQSLRCEDDLWNAFGKMAEGDLGRDEKDRDRSAVLRDFIRWYVGVRGSKMPRRPKLPEDAPK